MTEARKDDRQELEVQARGALGPLLVIQPGWLGDVLKLAQPTDYEEVTCIGLEPEQATLYAVVEIKREQGYGGDLCTGPGAYEYVRFFADWNGDGDFTDTQEDLGVASIAVHDVPGPKPLSYVASLSLTRRQLWCFLARPVTVRAVLEYNIVPPAGNPNPPIVWGNILDRHVQPKPGQLILHDLLQVAKIKVPPQLAELVDAQAPIAGPAPVPTAAHLVAEYGDKVPAHRSLAPHLATAHKALVADAGAGQDLPSLFASLIPGPLIDKLDLGAVLGKFLELQSDSTYEELHCVGLHPGLGALVGILTIKQPSGYLGGLCRAGSLEYVSFWADWDDNGSFDELLGTAAVRVHDEPVPAGGLSFAVFLPINLAAHAKPCGASHTARIRAVLSWNTPPPANPYLPPQWGSTMEALIQLPVGDPVVGQVPFLSVVGGMAIDQINPLGYANGPAVMAGFNATNSPFAGEVVLAGHIANPPDLSAGATPLRYTLHYRHESEPVGTAHDISNSFQVTLSKFSGFVWTQTPLTQVADPAHRYTYQEDLTINGPGGDQTFVEGFVLGRWETPGLPDGRYEVWFTADLGGGTTVDSNRVWVQLDNTAPVADITATGSPFVPQGTPLHAVITATDAHFAGYGLAVLPSGYPNTPVPQSGSLPVTAAPVSLSTTGVTPGGYVLRLAVSDRAIINSGYVGNVSTDDIGFCVEQA